MQKIVLSWKVWGAGLLSWAIPFFGSFPFYDPREGLMIPLILFKSIMVVLGALAGTALLVWVFRSLRPSVTMALAVGLLWMGLNWILDIAALLPMSGMDFGTWFTDVGIRYLTIPIIAGGMGLVANR